MAHGLCHPETVGHRNGSRTSNGVPKEGDNLMEASAIAHVCHEANRALQIEQADPTIPVSVLWEDLDEETRASAISGVQGILNGNTPEQSHENWVAFKVTHGWTLGPVKDEAQKEHPLLVPYDQLPPAQQIKDDLFSNVVNALQ
jgi:hypothetical protein